MTRLLPRCFALITAVIVALSLSSSLVGQGPKGSKEQPASVPDLSEFATLDRAMTAKITPSATRLAGVGFLGIHVKSDGRDLTISEVQSPSPASEAGLKAGDVLVKANGAALSKPEALRELLQSKGPGEKISLTVRRQQKTVDIEVTMGVTSRPKTGGGGGVGKQPKGKGGGTPTDITLPLWKENVYRLAVVIIDFSDIKHQEKITPESWQEALFSRNTYKMSATGQQAHGSLDDYFQEQSYGKFRIEGKAFAPVQVAKKRGDYVQGSGTSNKTAVLTDALAKFEAREAKDALKDFDGLCFIYAGARVQSNAGSVYYPQRGVITLQGKRWPYILCPEGGTSMENISVFALEFGKLLGLPHLAARTENPGSEGLGVWCLMSNGAGQNGKPLHLCAWCKEQLGWLNPIVIDPTVKQKLILRSVQTSGKECLKVVVRLDGSEYFLLENRTAKGFDADLPGQGLLIWRVVGDRPILEESHGVTGPTGPRVHLSSVPFPSKANAAFTPLTTPSSRSVTGGGLPVHLTNIRRLADGRVTLFVGYQYY